MSIKKQKPFPRVERLLLVQNTDGTSRKNREGVALP